MEMEQSCEGLRCPFSLCFSQQYFFPIKPAAAISQLAVFFSHNKSAPAIAHRIEPLCWGLMWRQVGFQ